MKKLWKDILALFSVFQFISYVTIIFALAGGYLYLTTKHLEISIAIGLVSSILAFMYYVYLPRRLERSQFLLKELQKYATSMTFYLQSGYNVLKALEASKKNLDQQIQKDIQRTITHLQKKATLDTSHFDKYKFPAINIFHQILRIKYEVGGDAKDLFTRVNKSVNFEIVKRDELYRRKRYMKNRVLVMMLMVLSMPLLFVLFANDIYVQFLELGYIAIGLNVLLFFLILISLYFLQRSATDISILD